MSPSISSFAAATSSTTNNEYSSYDDNRDKSAVPNEAINHSSVERIADTKSSDAII
jgi:hypothetical protein